jgi:Domain of unknown function (DUF5606)
VNERKYVRVTCRNRRSYILSLVHSLSRSLVKKGNTSAETGVTNLLIVPMEALKQIANIAGYSGLYRILKPSRNGVIVESLDDKKAKTMMGPTARVSVLNDISIYVDAEEQSKPLGDVLLAVNEKYGEKLTVDPKSSNEVLAEFMASVVPDYDRDRVRPTDIKKLIVWYGILRQYAPEAFEQVAGETTEPAAEVASVEAEGAPSDVVAPDEAPASKTSAA